MAKKMLIDATHAEETRVVVVDGNKVEEFDFESDSRRQLAGNIYLAKVTRVEPSLQAAFVDYGGNRHGFLAFSEIHPDYYQIPVADRKALMEEEARLAAEADEEEEAPKTKSRSRRSRKSGSKTSGSDAAAKQPADTAAPEAPREISGMETIDLGEDDETTGDEALSPMERVAETPVQEPQDADNTAEVSAEADDTAPTDTGAPDATGETSEAAPAPEPDVAPVFVSSQRADTESASDGAPADAGASDSPAPVDETPEAPLDAAQIVEPEAPIAGPETADEDDGEAAADPEPTPRPMAESNDEDAVVVQAEPGEMAQDAADTGTTAQAEGDDTEAAAPHADEADSDVLSEDAPVAAPDADTRNDDTATGTDAAPEPATDAVVQANGDADSDDTDSDNMPAQDTPVSAEQSEATDTDHSDDEEDAASETEDDHQGDADPMDASARDSDIESVSDDDSHDDIRPPRKSRQRKYKIQEVVKVRQIMLVQVVKEERGNKGAALTTYLSLAGRYCVLMPNTARGGGISRKITNAADRQKLKSIAQEIDVPKGAGLIIRTAGAKRTKTEIKRDYEYLQRLWEQIRELTLKSIAPAKIYEEGDLIKRSIRDLYNREIEEVLVEGEKGYRIAKDFMKMIMPSHAKNVQHYVDPMPLFARYQVETYLGGMFNPVVQLKSGGYIVIGITEALVAIDVNSGRATKEGSIEETALKTNLEAADEVARQLRLRDLAGLIVIDFIDMSERKNNASVEKRMKDKLKSDRARIQVGRISGFGLMEMSRQRLRPGMLEATTQPCPSCHGTGLIRSDDNMALQVLRAVEEEGTRRRSREVLVKCPVGIANFLMNLKREHVAQIEARYGMSVRIEADVHLVSPDFSLEKFKTATRAVPEATAPVVSVDTSIMDQVDEDAEIEEEDPDTEAAADAETEAQPGTEAQQGSETDNADDDSKPKKRRRRRRRKSKSRDQDDNATGDETSEEGDASADAPTDDTSAASEQASDATDAETDAEDGDDERASSPRRRSRSRSRRSRSGTPPETQGDDSAQTSEPSAEPEAAAPVAEDAAAAPAVDDTAQEPMAEAEASEPEAPAPEAPAPEAPAPEVPEPEALAPEADAGTQPAPLDDAQGEPVVAAVSETAQAADEAVVSDVSPVESGHAVEPETVVPEEAAPEAQDKPKRLRRKASSVIAEVIAATAGAAAPTPAAEPSQDPAQSAPAEPAPEAEETAAPTQDLPSDGAVTAEPEAPAVVAEMEEATDDTPDKPRRRGWWSMGR